MNKIQKLTQAIRDNAECQLDYGTIRTLKMIDDVSQSMTHDAVLGDVAIKEKVVPWLERLQHYLSSGSTYCFDNQYDEADGEELQELIDRIKGNVA